MALEELYRIISTYDRNSFNVFTQQGVEPKADDLKKFERDIGFRLPEEFREYALHPLGGLYVEVKEELWPRPVAFQVGPFWTFLYALRVYSLSSEAPDWMNMQIALRQFREEEDSDWVPFMRLIGDKDRYCFTPDQKIMLWYHDKGVEPDEESGTFSELVIEQIRDLTERKDKKLREANSPA
jgi:hypothetical protein